MGGAQPTLTERLSQLQTTNISTSTSMDARMYGMGIAIGDPDQDLDLDYYITNIGRNGLFQNELASQSFADITELAGVEDVYHDSLFTVGWGTFFADIDNDTDLDLQVTNGYIPAIDFIANRTGIPDRFYLNTGNNSFTEEAMAFGVWDSSRGRGSAFADFDMDGDIDFVVVPVNQFGFTPDIQRVKLYRNELANSNNWLKVKLQGVKCNRDAYGAHIKIVVGGQSWLHEVTGGSSHGSQNSSIAHFGLGTASMVDSLIVAWPGGGRQILTGLAVKQLLNIVQDTTQTSTQLDEQLEREVGFTVFPNPSSGQLSLSFFNRKRSAGSLKIMNSQGQLIYTFHQGLFEEGKNVWKWDGKDQSGWKLPSGLYFALLEMDGYRFSQSLIKQD